NEKRKPPFPLTNKGAYDNYDVPKILEGMMSELCGQSPPSRKAKNYEKINVYGKPDL
ncbi:hypothetical protein HispidOSU_016830, partial [Sigmodon hispidus]